MSNLYVAAEYKNKIINLLLRNKDFIKLVSPDLSKSPGLDEIDVLIGGKYFINGKEFNEQGHIFDYNFVDDTTMEERTFVFVETDIEYVRRNLLMDFNLYICVFTSKSLVRINDTSSPTVQEVKDMGYFASAYGNRVDILCDIVDRTLNSTNKIHGIGDIVPAKMDHMTIYTPNHNYYGKCLKYNITNVNTGGDICGI